MVKKIKYSGKSPLTIKGRLFHYRITYNSKSVATATAKMVRRSGTLVRVIPRKYGYDFYSTQGSIENTKPDKRRRFGGKLFRLFATYNSKEKATELADVQRTKRIPMNVRVVKSGGQYHVYVRRK